MTIGEKLFQIQQKVKATKSEYNSFGKFSYRSAEGIIESIKPILAETKTFITLGDDIREIGGRIYVEASAILHDTESDNIVLTKALAREADEKKGMDEAQITGAASSYARKYALSGLLLLDDNKDADSDEYTSRTQQKGNSEPKKTTSASAPVKKLKCADCGGEITAYQGQPAEKIAQATKKKYGKQICMECSAKRRAQAEAEAQRQEDQFELPFPMES